jgi:hypothetical protein
MLNTYKHLLAVLSQTVACGPIHSLSAVQASLYNFLGTRIEFFIYFWLYLNLGYFLLYLPQSPESK